MAADESKSKAEALVPKFQFERVLSQGKQQIQWKGPRLNLCSAIAMI